MKPKSLLYSIAICAAFATALFAVGEAKAACTEPAIGGDYTISSSCTFDTTSTGGVHGVDNGGMTINIGTTLTIGAGQNCVNKLTI